MAVPLPGQQYPGVMDLLRTFPPETWSQALDDWTWLDLTGKAPLCASPFGDAFLEADDGIWWLDHLEGRLTREFDNRESMSAALQGEDKQDHYLMAGLALAAERQGLVAAPTEVYGFEIPPVLGGPITVENVKVYSFVVYASLTAQIHRQVKDLPPGSPIEGFSFEQDAPEPRNKRRRLFGGR